MIVEPFFNAVEAPRHAILQAGYLVAKLEAHRVHLRPHRVEPGRQRLVEGCEPAEDPFVGHAVMGHNALYAAMTAV